MEADGDWLDQAIALGREEDRQEEERRRREEEQQQQHTPKNHSVSFM